MSAPNADFFARLLQSLGVSTAHVGLERGEPLVTRLNGRQASTSPILREFVGSYGSAKLMNVI